METKTTVLKLSLVALLMFISSTIVSASYYVCSGSTFTVTASTAAPTGMVYKYDVIKDGTPVSSNLTTAPTTFTGAGSYEIVTKTVVEPANNALCPPANVSTIIVVLDPSITMSPSTTSFCGAATNNSSVITPTTAGWLASFSNDLELVYTYSVNNGTTTVDGATLGSINATTGVYTLTTTTPGTYTVTGTVKYAQKTGFTNKLIGTGCEVSTTTTTIITVTSPSAAPTITVS